MTKRKTRSPKQKKEKRELSLARINPAGSDTREGPEEKPKQTPRRCQRGMHKERVEGPAAPSGGRDRARGEPPTHSKAGPRGSAVGGCCSYLAGFVKLLLQPRHRHLPPPRGGGAARADGPAGPRGRPGLSLCHPHLQPRAQGNIASPAGSAGATPLAAAGGPCK